MFAYDPRSGISLREMMDRLFNEAFVMPRERNSGGRTDDTPPDAQTPPVNMYETDAELIVVLPLPGVSPHDLQIELLGTTLSVRADYRRDEPHPDAGPAGGAAGPGDFPRKWLLHEFHIGPYARTVELPYQVDADRVRTTYEHGLLTMRLPCPEAKQPRRINVQGS